MSEKQSNSSQEDQDTKYPDAKPAQKAEHYEDFTVLAERLKKEGRLDEGNYKKLRTIRFVILNSIMALTIAAFFVKEEILSFIFLGFFIFMIRRSGINRLCFLYTLGKVADGTIIEVKKEFIRNKVYRFFYDIVFKFSNGVKTIRLIEVDQYYNTKLNKSRKVGDVVKVFYNPENPYDATTFHPKRSHFNLLVTNNK